MSADELPPRADEPLLVGVADRGCPDRHTRAFAGSGCRCPRGGDVLWRPAVDINRLVVAIGAVAVAYLFHARTHREDARQGGD
jgi:hypothetical protein